MAVITQDVPLVLATAPVLLTTLSCSRVHALEGDHYALTSLRRPSVSATPLASLLETMAEASADSATSRSDVLSSPPVSQYPCPRSVAARCRADTPIR